MAGSDILDKIKQPSFWISILGIVGTIGAALTGSGEPHLIAIGGILTGVYTIVDHLKDAIVQAAGVVSQAKVDAAAVSNGNGSNTGLPPFYQSDAQHPATPAGAGYTMPTVQPSAAPAQGVSPMVVADQQAQINDVSKQIADLHAALNKAVARANDPAVQ